MQILGPWCCCIVEVKSFLLLFRLDLAILCLEEFRCRLLFHQKILKNFNHIWSAVNSSNSWKILIGILIGILVRKANGFTTCFHRKMVPSLVQAGYRVVAPDFIGFGKSDKYSDMTNYTHEMHLFCLKYLMDSLNLKSGVTLVCQDWGGMIWNLNLSYIMFISSNIEIVVELWMFIYFLLFGWGKFNQNWFTYL